MQVDELNLSLMAGKAGLHACIDVVDGAGVYMFYLQASFITLCTPF